MPTNFESADKDPKITIGVELECILWDPAKGQAVDVDEVFPGGISTGRAFEKIGRDTGIASLEFATRIASEPGELTNSFLELRKRVKEKAPHLTLLFQSRAPRSGEALAKKDRYKAFFEALQMESPEHWQRAYEMPKWNSTQFHLGIDPMSPQGISIMNILNDISPYAAWAVTQKFQVVGEEGHLGIWQKYADSRRFSEHGRWFSDPEELKSFYGSVPRLIKVEKDAQGAEHVVPDLESMSRHGDPISEGTIWWFARPRVAFSTIEWRSFPSLQPSHVLVLAKDVHALAVLLKKELPQDRVVTPDEYPALYAKLAKLSYLVPEKPLTKEEWNKLAEREPA